MHKEVLGGIVRPHHFSTPTEQEIFEALGVLPEPDPDEALVRLIRIDGEGDEYVALSYDVAAGGIRVRWYREGSCLLDFYREGASRLQVGPEISVSFDFDGLTGELVVERLPRIRIIDKLLFA